MGYYDDLTKENKPIQSDDLEIGSAFLEHHGILGQKWGKKGGPPYPLGSGDHSSSEKNAAKAAGVKVGQDSGKGSIENLSTVTKGTGSSSVHKSSSKKTMTEEEKREAALQAARSGDKKKITKYMDYLTTDELREAQARSQVKDSLTKPDPDKMSKADVDKIEAIRSGDKEKVKEFADKMSYQELVEAMNKVDLTAKLNYVAPPKSTTQKIDEFVEKVDKARGWAEKGIDAYNVMARLYNSTHKDGDTKWPIIETKNDKEKFKEEKKTEQVAKDLTKKLVKDTADNVKEAKDQNFEKESKQRLENAKIEYKNQQKYQEFVKKEEEKVAKREEKEAAKEAKKAEKEAAKEAGNTPVSKTLSDAENDFYNQLREESLNRMYRDDTRPTSAELTANEERYFELLNSYR